MPLSDPAPRQALHDRDIVTRGYKRDDGHWDIEGRLTDRKGYSFDNKFRGRIHPGEALHDMSIRMTVDANLKILAMEAVTDAGPFGLCPQITPNFQRFVGEQVGPGWRKKIHKLVGGTQGCVHLGELMGILGTVAMQTVYPSRDDGGWASSKGRPAMIDTCHAWASDGPVVAEHFPEHHRKREPAATGD